MATNSNAGNGHDLARGLGKEIRARQPKVAVIDVTGNAAGSASTSPATSPATSLEQTLKNCLANSSRTANLSKKRSREQGFQVSRGDTGKVGLASSRSVSSDSSGSFAEYFSPNSREMERNTAAAMMPFTNRATSATVGSHMELDRSNGINSSQLRLVLQAAGGEGGGPKSNSPSTVGSGKNSFAASACPGVVKGKGVKQRRSRKSKKPPTQIVVAEAGEFRAKVQELTGIESTAALVAGRESHATVQATAEACIVRQPPQTPERSKMDIDTQCPGLGPGFVVESSSKPLSISVRCPSMVPDLPMIANQLQATAHKFSYGDDYESLGLNHTMGFNGQSLVVPAESEGFLYSSSVMEDSVSEFHEPPAHSSKTTRESGRPFTDRSLWEVSTSEEYGPGRHDRQGEIDYLLDDPSV